MHQGGALSKLRAIDPSMSSPRLRFAAVIFFLSGASGLVYQVVWSRVLNEVFGVSALAVTAVLATYLGGLALGGLLLGRLADRSPSPLRLYAILELGVAVAAAAGTYAARLLDPLHLRIASALLPNSVALLAARVILAAVVVLPATILMGATLPAMTRVFVRRIGRVGRGLSGLYAVNTAGAVAGCLLAGFVLIRALGVHGTLWAAVAVNVLVCGAALLLARGADAAEPAQPHAPEKLPERAKDAGRGVLVAIALSGFASLSLEVVWTRMLILVLGTSTYAFVTMLATFLTGIALGSLVARPAVDRLRNPRRAFGILQVAIGASTIATLPQIRALLAYGGTWLESETSWLGLASVRFGVSFLVMLLPTTLIGATFPLATRMWATRIRSLGGSIGEVYAANTAGNILGAAGGGFLLLPALGMQRSVAAIAAANLAVAVWGLFPGRGSGRLAWARSAPALLGLVAAGILLAGWRPSSLPSTGGGALDPVLFYEEGLVSTVKVFERASDGSQRVMAADGITIGQSSAGVDKKQQVLAHLPFLVAPDGSLRRVLSIGLGTGILVAEAAKHSGVEDVEVVEISPSVVEGSRHFGPYNGGIPDDPKVRVIADDGVLYLRRAAARYDAIIADGKSRSGHAGNAVFYSEDFYRAALGHMTSNGLFLQWVPLDVAPGELRVIVRTFVRSFPHAYVWLGQESCFLLGQTRPLEVDVPHVQDVLSHPAAAHLARYGWRRAEEALAMLVGDHGSVVDWLAGGTELNSLERPILEFFSLSDTVDPEHDRVAANLSALAAVRERPLSDVQVIGESAEALSRSRGAVGAALDGLVALNRDQATAAAYLHRAAEASPPGGIVRHIAAEALFEVGRALDLGGHPEDALAWYGDATSVWPGFVEARVNAAKVEARRGLRAEAERELEMALAENPLSGPAHRLLGELQAARGDTAEAVVHLRRAARLASQDAEVHEDLGLALARTGGMSDALAEFQEALRLRPNWGAALGRVALLLAVGPDPAARRPAEAVRLARRAVEQDPTDASLFEVLAASCAAAGNFDEAARAERTVLRMALDSGDLSGAGSAREAVRRYEQGLPPATIGATAAQ